MERVYVSFTLQNFITIGLIFAFWYFLVGGGWSLLKNLGSSGGGASPAAYANS